MPHVVTFLKRFDSMNELNAASSVHLDEAEALGRRSTDGLIRLLGEEDERSLRARRRLAGPLYRKGKVDEAERLYRRNHEVSLSALGEEHLFTMIATREYGTILEVQGRWEEAEPLLRWTLQGYRRLLGDDDYVSLHWMDTFGWMLYRNGEREEGERLLREGVSGLRRVMGERNLLTAYATRRLARMERDLGNHEKGVELLRHCVDVQREVLGVQHRDTIENIEMLGSWLAERGSDHLDEAEALAREATDLSRRFRGHDDELTFESMDTLAVVLHMQGRKEEAVVEFEAVAAAARDTAGDNGWFTRMSAVHYGRCLLELDRYDEAESILLTAYNNDNESACDALIDLYEAWGQPEKAAEYRQLQREAEGAGTSD